LLFVSRKRSTDVGAEKETGRAKPAPHSPPDDSCDPTSADEIEKFGIGPSLYELLSALLLLLYFLRNCVKEK
jgi:hypothetical protein